MANLTLHCLVTLSFALSHTQPRGYGFRWGLVSKPNFLTINSKTKLTWEPGSNSVSIFVCLDTTIIWNTPILSFSLTWALLS